MALALFSGPGQAYTVSLKKRVWDGKITLGTFTVNPLQLPTIAPINMSDNMFRTGLMFAMILIMLLLLVTCLAKPIYYCFERCKRASQSPTKLLFKLP
jgi:hypothetical protein